MALLSQQYARCLYLASLIDWLVPLQRLIRLLGLFVYFNVLNHFIFTHCRLFDTIIDIEECSNLLPQHLCTHKCNIFTVDSQTSINEKQFLCIYIYTCIENIRIA